MTGKNFYNPDRLGVPGPGQYYSERINTHLRKEPTWRIGTSTREDAIKKIKREGLPGPGNYKIASRAIEGRKFGFGTSKRDGFKSNFTPGPGQYHIPCSIVDVPNYMTYSGSFQKEFRYI